MDDLTMERLSLVTTMACNLNCKLCVADAPYRKGEYNFTLEEQETVIAKYFDVVAYVNKFTLAGGEPLLFPELPELLIYIKEKYLDRIGVVEIITNGTICPGEDLVDVCKQFYEKIVFLVDNYGKNLSICIAEIDRKLSDAGIPHTIRNNMTEVSHCGGWVDFGDPLIQKDYPNNGELMFSNCAQAQKLNFCFSTSQGIMYPCEYVRRCIQFGVTPGNPNEYVNLLDDTLTVDELREKIKNIYRLKSLSACTYCKGMCDDSERFPPAEQLTTEELGYVRKGARSYHEVKKMMDHVE